jgi:hypothetical protein
MPEPYAVARFQLRAVIGEHVFNDVVQFTSSFEMNGIPEATLSVAVGRRVDTQQVATIHRAIADLRIQMPAQVYLRAVVTDRDRASSGLAGFDDPNGKLIFEGFAVGTGWQRSTDSANFTIHLVHWLIGLHYASAISASAHPSNPADWKYPAAFAASGLGTAEASAGAKQLGRPSWIPQINVDDVTIDALKEDLWGNVIHPWMLNIASADPVETRLNQNAPINPTTQTAQMAINAIERLAPNTAGVPLKVNLDGIDDTFVSEGLRQALQNESGSSWLNTTLWGKLVGEWSPSYWFAVVPRVSDGLIVPFTGGLQGDPWAKILDVDYNHCTANAQLHQVLRCVGIGYPMPSATGLTLGGPITDHTGMCGFFQPTGVTEGLILIKEPPQWLMNPDIVNRFCEAATGNIGAAAIGTGLDEDGTGKSKRKTRDLKAARLQQNKIMDRFAQQWYVIEMLKGRLGEISGKLRFDIAPGSNIMLEAGIAKNLTQAEDALTTDIFATVNRVSMAINAEKSQAGTAFSIAHTRTPAENSSPATSVAGPPLYTKAWRGAKLVP